VQKLQIKVGSTTRINANNVATPKPKITIPPAPPESGPEALKISNIRRCALVCRKYKAQIAKATANEHKVGMQVANRNLIG